MATEFAYMPTVKNLPDIFGRIKEAGAPTKFTHEFLKSNLGFTSSNDRAVVKLLRHLGFLSGDGVPTDRYHEFRGQVGERAIAEGLRDGWPDVFLSDQKAHERTPKDLADIFKKLTGQSDPVAKKMATTFKALTKMADWSEAKVQSPKAEGQTEREDEKKALKPRGGVEMRELVLNQDIHLHLPSTSDVSVYRAIFQALKEELL